MADEQWTFDKAEEVMRSITNWWQNHFLEIVRDKFSRMPEPYKSVLKMYFIDGIKEEAIMSIVNLHSLGEVSSCILDGVDILTDMIANAGGAYTLTPEKTVWILTGIKLTKERDLARVYLNDMLYYSHPN